MGARQLGPGVCQLAVHVIQLFRHVLIQGDVSRLLLVIQEKDHVDEGDTVLVQVVDDAAVVLLIGGIGAVQQLHHLVVHVQRLGQLPGCQGVGQHVAVHGLDVAQPHDALHLRLPLQFRQQGLLLLIVSGGHQHGHKVGAAEGVLDLLLRDLILALLKSSQGGVAVDIRAFAGQQEGRNQ